MVAGYESAEVIVWDWSLEYQQSGQGGHGHEPDLGHGEEAEGGGGVQALRLASTTCFTLNTTRVWGW